jgi:hypothetical protein
MSRVALGFKPRTGRAVLVVLAGDVRHPEVLEREEIPLLPEGEWAPYHAAEGLPSKDADRKVKQSIAEARRMATGAIRAVATRYENAGYELAGCGVLVGTGLPDWTTDQILAVHVRMHKVEGEIFREVLVDGARKCGLEISTLPDKTALDAAARTLRITRTRLDANLADIGKAAGAPWGRYQKEAAAAALVVLHDTKEKR